MAELLIEIFSEEIPARMQEKAGGDLAKALTVGLTKAGLTIDAAQSLTGPRRLVFAADVPLKSPDVSDERKGPRVGAPDRALEGFMKAAGLTDISQAEIREDKKGQFYIAKIEKQGQPTADILAALLPEIMNNFPWPKSMKSGASSFRWVRPLQGLICLLGGESVDIEVGGVKTGRVTEGHRRHGKGPFTVKDFADYRAQLEASTESGGHVMLSAQDRKDKILSDAKAVCAAKGLELVEDIGLLNEVSGLAEWPVVILGEMDKAFLELPDEVIRLTLKSHQKTFTVRDPKTGKLAPYYIIVANQIAPDGGEAIKKGNGKVISARLSDARFFQTEDAKLKLEDYYEKLDTVVFHKKLGTIKDKAERVAALARDLAPKVGADPDKAAMAAKLAKCDLVTQTVIEFTSLEGQIGALMYEAEHNLSAHSGESRSLSKESADARDPDVRQDERNWGPSDHADIAEAIEQHYKPKGPSDAVPTNPTAVAVALADKLDTLVGFWAIDEKPTGSKDPFALRRAALGLVRVILENDVRLDLVTTLVIASIRVKLMRLQRGQEQEKQENLTLLELEKLANQHEANEKKLEADLINVMKQDGRLNDQAFGDIANLTVFIANRLKIYLTDLGARHDVLDAVITLELTDVVSLNRRVEALQAFLSTDDGENLMAGYKRAANILKAEAKKGELPSGAPSKPDQAEAVALYDALMEASPAIESALNDENYAEAMQNLAKLRAPIDDFFDHVTVVSDDTAVRENNLRLLILIRDTARQIADFEAIQG